MKTTGRTRMWRVAVIAILATLAGTAAGCADGELWSGGAGGPGFDLTPTPLIIRFSADPAVIKPGESTTISWEVADADSVEITAVAADGNPVGFSVSTTELSGSAPVAALSSTTDFILTASKTYAVPAEGEGEVKADDLAPEPSGPSSVSQTITVTVISPTAIEASITADKAEAMSGEQTVIRWNVSPAEGVSVDVAADSDEPIVATDQCEGDLQSILDAATENPLDPKPAVGCAVVAPAETTVYTVTATDANDPNNVVTATAEVGVSEAVLDIVSFTANEQENAAVLNFNDPVQLKWLVTPAGALVTIEASPAAGCELPVDKPSTGELESLSCTVAANTTFTLTARMGEASAEPRVVTVSQQVSGSADLKITAAGWAFPSEEVDIKIEPAVAGSAAAITKITIDDAKEASGLVELPGFAGQAQIIRNVRVPTLGVRVRWECTGCAAPRDALAVTALPAAPRSFYDANDAPLAITRIAPVSNTDGAFYYGVQRNGYSGGVAKVFKAGMTFENELLMNVEFGAPLFKIDNLDKHLPVNLLGKMSYPVGAIATMEDGRLFVGVTGAIMFSEDGGGSWTLYEALRRFANRQHPYPGSHPTCAGEIQGGIEYSGSDTMLVSLGGLCDIVTLGGDQLMAATDRGVYTLASAEAHFQDRNANPWKGMPPQGGSHTSGAEYLTYSRVVNDLEVVGGKVFAAASKGSGTAKGGVFVSDDQGATWKEFGLADTDTYSLTYDKQTQKLYAGTAADGVKVSGTDSASWADVGTLGQPVFSLAVDPYSAGGVVMAGTSEGISIIRNAAGGGVWAAVSAGGADGVGKVRALTINSKVDDAAGKVNHYLSIGTAKGVIAGNVQVSVTGVVNTAPPAKEPPAEEPPADDESPEDQPQP